MVETPAVGRRPAPVLPGAHENRPVGNAGPRPGRGASAHTTGWGLKNTGGGGPSAVSDLPPYFGPRHDKTTAAASPPTSALPKIRTGACLPLSPEGVSAQWGTERGDLRRAPRIACGAETCGGQTKGPRFRVPPETNT